MKSKLIILSAVVLMFSASQVFAGEGHDHGDHVEETVVKKKDSIMEHKGSMMESDKLEVIIVGNKICPVSNQVIADMGDGKGVQVEYQGKLYNLCCTMCEKDFKKNPEKFIKKINEELEMSEHKEHDDQEGMDVDDEDDHNNDHDHSGHDH